MNAETIEKLGKASNTMEQEIFDFITARNDECLEKRIIDKKLTIKDCLAFCFKCGKKFEVKSGNAGCAKISEEQHWKWVREYFGIKDTEEAAADTKPTTEAASVNNSKFLSLDLDGLLD